MFVLLALMLLALFTGCRAYRRTDVTAPGHYVTNTDGAVSRGFQYRSDGYPAGTRYRGYHHGSHIYGQDGLVTGRDGVAGSGNLATRPHTSGVTGMDGISVTPYGSVNRSITPSVTPRIGGTGTGIGTGTGTYNR